MPVEAAVYVVRFTARSKMPKGIEPFNLWGTLRESLSTPPRFSIHVPVKCFPALDAPHTLTTQEAHISFVEEPSPNGITALQSRLEESIRIAELYSDRGLTPLDAYSGFALAITRE